MKYVIIGTAGHVDHGKSALIKALTGTDTDRLKEEKARGISIDLGFALLPLGEEIMAGIVDVPGHERFLKNMLAGTGGIDLAMLVIAADEGVMPQTREHLAMLHFYGIKRGVVVLNKIDKVDEEWLELVEEEVVAALAGTFLADAPICRVSAVSGAGLETLQKTLYKAAAKITQRDITAPFRLWIDRVFTVKGYGAVVTGTVLHGLAAAGDTLALYPSAESMRVRGTEFHGQPCAQVQAGQRAALNVAGAGAQELRRGMFLSQEGYGLVSSVWDVRTDLAEEVISGTRVRLHLGTGEFLGRLYAFKNSDASYMRLLLEEPLAAAAGDRGIIRLYSPQQLLGGVMLIGPGRQSRRLAASRRQLAEALAAGQVAEAVSAVVADCGSLTDSREIKRRTGYFSAAAVDESIARLVETGKVIALEQLYAAPAVLEAITRQAAEMLAEFHSSQPYLPGLSREMLRQKLGLKERDYEKISAYWQDNKTIYSVGKEAALPEHAKRFGQWQKELLYRSLRIKPSGELTVWEGGQIAGHLEVGSAEQSAALAALTASGAVVPLDNGYVYRQELAEAVRLLQDYFKEEPELTVSQLRIMLNTSRKIAMALTEYLDGAKFTQRSGDVRRAGPRLKEGLALPAEKL